MMTTEAEKTLKQKILSKRKQMIGMSSAIHWCKIHSEVRKVLEEGYLKLGAEQIAKITGFSEESIKVWMAQAQFIKDLSGRVAACKRDGRMANSMSILIRADVCRLARIIGLRAASAATGVARSSITNWLNLGFDAEATLEEVGIGANLVPASPDVAESVNKETEAIPIEMDAEAKQLAQFLERHKGKIHKKYSLAEKKLMMALADRFGSKAVHEYFGVSYDTIARLKRRQEVEIERKARTPLRYLPVIDLMKKHPGMGPMQIRDYIYRHLGLSMSVNSIRKVMEQNGWVPPFVKTSRIADGLQLYEAARKNYLWHMDFKHQYVNSCKCFLLFVQDDFSRFIVGSGIADGEKVDVVITAMEEAIRIHGKPESVMSDGGSAFYSWRGSSRFTRFLEDYGIEQMIAETPNVNGKLENLNQQIEKELLMTTEFASIDHFRRELAKWVGHYNFSRPHQGLSNRQVPADRYFPGASTWYGKNSEITRQQSLIAETMSTLLSELKKSS